MRTRFIILAACLLAAAPAYAKQEFDPAARAKVIAPFIDQQAFAVVYVDLERIDAEKILALAQQLIPTTEEEVAMHKKELEQPMEALRRADVKELFLVLSLTDIPQHKPLIVVPLKEASTANSPDRRAEMMKTLDPGFETVVVGDFLLVGEREVLKRARGIKPDPRPELARAIEAAGDTAIQAVLLPPSYTQRVVEEMMPTLPEVIGGGPSTVLTRGVRWAALGVNLPPQLSATLVVQSADPQAAVALKARWDEVARLAGGFVVQGKSPAADAALAFLLVKLITPRVQGDRLVVDVDKTSVSPLKDLFAPAMKDARAKAIQVQSMNNLKQIALAMFLYAEGHKTLPPAAICDAQGKPLLSWRVLLLPYLNQEALYKQFHLDEPWDSPHNRELTDKMPAVYRSPDNTDSTKLTSYLVPVGKETVFPTGGQGTKLADLKAPADTILVVEADRTAVWTKPDDLSYDAKKPAASLGGQRGGSFAAAYADGHVATASTSDEKQLRSSLEARR